MSRAIKFRVWSPSEELFKTSPDGMVGKVGNFVSPSRIELNENGELFDLHGEPVVFEQFVGLLDSEGKEIYEGDIVSVIYPEYQEAKVFYCPHSASFRLLSKNVALPMITMRTVEGQNAKLIPIFNEVLGNIHENPELLAA